MDTVIRSHFQKNDPILFPLFHSIILEDLPYRKPKEYFVCLCREIIGQQLSGKVADIIYSRFAQLFPKKIVTPLSIQQISDETLRATGMSWSKASFIRDLSKKVIAKEIDLGSISDYSDQEVIRRLTKIKGIGPWTAEMFLMFTLRRPDVFSYGDLGLKRGLQKLYGLKKEPTIKQMEKIVSHWKPYRTFGARLLWKYLEI